MQAVQGEHGKGAGGLGTCAHMLVTCPAVLQLRPAQEQTGTRASQLGSRLALGSSTPFSSSSAVCWLSGAGPAAHQ